MSAPTVENRHRVVVLAGGDVRQRKTCATLIEAGLNVVGICHCNQKTLGLPLKYIWKSLGRRSPLKTLGQIAGRLVYNALNRSRDRQIERRLYNVGQINEVLAGWKGEVHFTADYSRTDTLAWLKAMKPDILLIHTPAWVGKSVRAIPRTGIVLGGHPGLTPFYRGCHSAFWAIYQGKPEDVGWTVFWVDAGVDTGDVVVQGRVAIEPGDSYFTLGWKGMIEIAGAMARVVADLDRGVAVPRRPHQEIPPGSEYPVPTLLDYLAYRRRQRDVR